MSAKRSQVWTSGLSLWLFTGLCALHAIEPGDVIINEVYFDNYTKDRGTNHFEAVELLVVKDKINLNGLQISDRDIWTVPSEFQCILQDAGQGFLQSVRSGTLLVIYDGAGDDDTDGEDFTITLYARSSLFCNLAGRTNAFYLGNYGDNLHLMHNNKQVDFIKYRPNNRPERGGDPGNLEWDKGFDGFIDVGLSGESTGFRFLGDKQELNAYPAAWQAYSESYFKSNNLGKPNGGRNTVWIEKLRQQSSVK
ncbi:MAG: hypothetical protein H0X66_11955 [Verrucomicrobia bacterium]|nr:hypothetical protein [Verrucomicrobiota bacterium]